MRQPKRNRTIEESDLAAARALLRDMNPELRSRAADWYPLVHDRCVAWSCETGYTTEQCAAVLALYSINSTWTQNVKSARRALRGGQVKGLRIVRQHVTAILAGEPPELHLTKGSKVNAFYHSILLDDKDACCIDRWLFRLFNRRQSETWYPWVSRCVRILALEQDVSAATMQAILWIAITARDGVKYSNYSALQGEVPA